MSHLVTLTNSMCFKDLDALKNVCDKLSFSITKEKRDIHHTRGIATSAYCLYFTKIDTVPAAYIDKNGIMIYEDCIIGDIGKKDLDLLKQYYSVTMLKKHFGEQLCYVKEYRKNGDILMMINGTVVMNVKKGGAIKYIYNESIDLSDIDAFKDFETEIKRASYVEPEGDKWSVDFAPCGVNEKVEGFSNRSDAIEFELKEIESKYL